MIYGTSNSSIAYRIVVKYAVGEDAVVEYIRDEGDREEGDGDENESDKLEDKIEFAQRHSTGLLPIKH